MNRSNLISGALLTVCIHCGINIISTLFSHILGIFIEYDIIPLFRILFLGIEILTIIFILNKMDKKYFSERSTLVKLAFIAAGLFIASQYSYTFEYSPGFCGNALLDGIHDELFNNRRENIIFVNHVENFVLSIFILIYSLFSFRKSHNPNTA